MLEHVDIGIAMQSATEKLKEVVDELTGSPKEDSLYDCFIKHGLIKPQQ